jgi:hypothetical protein
MCFGEGAVFFRNIAAHGVLQVRDRFHVPDMILAAHAQRIFAADVEHVAIDRRVAEGAAVAPHGSSPISAGRRLRSGYAVPAKNLSTNSVDSPTASKICAPQ